MIAAVLAASLSFTATATGVGKGTPLEFIFAGNKSDRDYEAMFLLEEPIDVFCRRLEQAGLPRGMPTDVSACRLWPVGCQIEFSPSLDKYVATTLPEGLVAAPPVYTGGSRDKKGEPVASTEMPAAVFSLYTLSQSPILFDGIYDQGVVYGAHLAALDIKKGTKVKFTVSWDPKSFPRHLDIQISETNAPAVFTSLRTNSSAGSVDVTVSFDPEMTVDAARTAATALSLIDSPKVKLNGYAKGNLFYKAFLPVPSWSNRADRLVQPFELTLTKDAETLVFIEEDWSVEGDDPKLTLKSIPFSDAQNHPKTDTCFIYAQPDCKLARVFSAMEKLKGTSVRTWYVFIVPNP